jgi:hypothetical protein
MKNNLDELIKDLEEIDPTSNILPYARKVRDKGASYANEDIDACGYIRKQLREVSDQ